MTNTIEQTPLVEGRDEDESARIFAIKEAADCTLDEAETFFDDGDWYAYTDDEADEKCQEYIQDSLWAFNASFLEEMTKIPAEMFAAVQEKCEGANEAFEHCINSTCGLEKFVERAISADGRGHFLSPYDGDEYEATINGTTYYCYRAN